MAYSFREHTSDIIIEARNSTFARALEDVAEGMFTQMGAGHAEAKESLALDAKAPNREELVVNLLSAIIAECESAPFTPKKLKIVSLAEKGGAFFVSVNVLGERKVPENIIKAVTYHGLKVERKKKEWAITVLFDI